MNRIRQERNMREVYRRSKGILFAFVTSGNEVTADAHEQFAREQGLQNAYRISGDDYNRPRELFAFERLPFYLLLDERGHMIKRAARMALSSELEE